jgi:hypothetical protein
MPRQRSRAADPLGDEIEIALLPEQFIGSGFDDDYLTDTTFQTGAQAQPGGESLCRDVRRILGAIVDR